jgi:uncharacterized membrane protein
MDSRARDALEASGISVADKMLASHTMWSDRSLFFRSHAHPRAERDVGRAAGNGRITGVDAARGLAMVLVCLSHIRDHFLYAAPDLYPLLTNITRLATPSFLLLSGFVAAYVLRTSTRTNARIALIDRALFVLLVGHLLLGLEDLRAVDAQQWLLGRVVITDAIAVCLIVAALLRGFSASARIVLGISLALLSWPIAMLLDVQADAARYVAAVLFNARSAANGLVDAALIPYLGVFLIGMGLSGWVGPQIDSGDNVGAARKLLLTGACAIGCTLAGIGAWFLIVVYFAEMSSEPAVLDLLRPTLDPRHKLPPSPAYLLFYGGGGLVMAGLCLLERPRVIMRPIVSWAAVLGRASLMCFLVQDWLLKLVPDLLGFNKSAPMAFWIVYFLATVAILHWLASLWDAAKANRFLTVGLKALARRLEPQAIEGRHPN